MTREAVLGVLSLILWALIVVVTLEIRADPVARGQQRRRRDAGIDGAGAARARPERRRRRALRHHQRGAVLWRCDDHAGAVGAVRDRRPQGRNAGVRSLRRAAHRRHSRGLVRRAVDRHRAGSQRSSARSRSCGSSPSPFPASSRSAAIPRCCWPSTRSTACASWRATAMIGLITLGAVFLAVTGAEALYADLGHFGRKPIQTAWVALVLPALALNYLGQGALRARRSEGDREPVLPALSATGRCCRWSCWPRPRP